MDDICYLCGLPIYKDTGSWDHVVPLSLNGTNGRNNTKRAHKVCNNKKSNFLIQQLGKVFPPIPLCTGCGCDKFSKMCKMPDGQIVPHSNIYAKKLKQRKIKGMFRCIECNTIYEHIKTKPAIRKVYQRTLAETMMLIMNTSYSNLTWGER